MLSSDIDGREGAIVRVIHRHPRTISYVIAVALLLAVALRVLAEFVFIGAFDPFQTFDLIVAFAGGILVPIWAVLLARGAAGLELSARTT